MVIDNLICPRCGISLPSHARFCSACGEQVKKKKDVEIPLSEVLTAPSLPIAEFDTQKQSAVSLAEFDTQKQSAVPLSRHRTQTVNKPLFRVRAARQQIVGMLGSNSDSTRDGDALIRHPVLLARSLLNRVRSHSLLRNSIYIVATGLTTSIFGFCFWILATHLYSTYDVGLGSALISAMTLAAILATLGVGSTMVQKLPRRRTGYGWSLMVNAGLAIGIVAGLLAGVIALVMLPLSSQQFAIVRQNIGYAFAFVAGVPLTTISLSLDQVFIAERAAHNMLLRNAAVAILKIPLMVLPVVLMIQVGALGIFSSGIVAMAVAVLVALLLVIPRLKRGYRLAVRGIGGQVRSMLSSLTGNYFINMSGVATPYLLPVLVSILLSPAANAYYYTTSRVGDFFLVGSAAVASSLFAEGSHAADDLPRKVRSSALIIGMLMGPGMLICFFGGYYLLSVFGSAYAQHGLTLLRIDVVSTIPDAITNIYTSVLRIYGRLRFAALLNLGMAALTLVLSAILLPIMGIAGEGLAFLISESVGSLASGIDVIRMRRHRREIGRAALESDSVM